MPRYFWVSAGQSCACSAEAEAGRSTTLQRNNEKCNTTVFVVDEMTNKRAAHNIGEWYECKLCDLKFRHPGSLRDHNNRKHNVASNCECTICGMMFEDSYGLKKHGRVHSNEQPFACRYCPKRFKSPNAHRSHELIHQGVVFTCEYCTKTYRYKSLLNMHVKKEHKKQVAESETKNVEIHLGRKEREETTQAGKEW